MLDRTQKKGGTWEGKRSGRWEGKRSERSEKGNKKRRNGDGIFLH